MDKDFEWMLRRWSRCDARIAGTFVKAATRCILTNNAWPIKAGSEVPKLVVPSTPLDNSRNAKLITSLHRINAKMSSWRQILYEFVDHNEENDEWCKHIGDTIGLDIQIRRVHSILDSKF